MANHKYRLTYFDISGRGELSRMIFHYADVPFEDVRIQFEDWDNVMESNYP